MVSLNYINMHKLEAKGDVRGTISTHVANAPCILPLVVVGKLVMENIGYEDVDHLYRMIKAFMMVEIKHAKKP